MNTKTLNDGQTHKIVFSNGKLYLDEVQIAGEGITPMKDIVFEFRTNLIVEEPVTQETNEFVPILEVNVHDSIKGKAVGPGQV